jgi:RND family efflux transporter MFP subunit
VPDHRRKVGRRARATLAVLVPMLVAAEVVFQLAAAQDQPASADRQTPGDAPSPIESWFARQIDRVMKSLSFGQGAEKGSIQDPAQAPRGAGSDGPPAAPVVTVSHPIVRDVVEWDEYTGRFEPVEMVEVRARVTGYLQEVHFKDGQVVEAGDLLFTIDPRPFERALDIARAELQQARTSVENTLKDVERGRALVERKILSEREFEDRVNRQRDAEAAEKVAAARVKTAELELSFTRIPAAIAGRMSRSNVTAGNYVASGGSVGATVLTTIVRQDPIHVYFDVSENHTLKYKRLAQAGHTAGAAAVGAVVQIALADEEGFPHHGRLDFSDNRLDPGTGTLRARAVLDNNSGLFSPGMFARVRLAGSAKYSALLLPDEAVGTDQTRKFVYIVGEDGTVARKPVVLGPLIDGLRVVRAGLAAHDWVIIKGVQRARPGLKVAPRREPLEVSTVSSGPEPTVKQ